MSDVSTISSRIALRWWQVGSKDGIVEDVEIRWHAVVTFIIVQNLKESTLCVSVFQTVKLLRYTVNLGLFVQSKFLTCADLRTAILRTIGGIFSPKDAGIDFWMFPTVTPPYLWGKTKTLEKRSFQLSLFITAAQQRQNVFRTTVSSD